MTANSDIAIRIRGLGKAYRIVQGQEKHTTLGEAIAHRIRHPFQRLERETFWALKDVDLDIKKGDVVGIIGRNGAGKSTLLKILSRITEPTTGEVDLYGRVGSLLEVGTGFHPELTGRENIFLNGAILGMKRREILRQFDAIVEFAGVEKFLDTPVKRYSSGMYVRLAFAVAAHLNPEILLVDEVLAVGDAEFQKKCLGKMKEVSTQQGRTVLFVSHNMAAVEGLCDKGVVLRSGEVAFNGSSQHAVASYLALVERAACEPLDKRADRSGQGASQLVRVEVTGPNGFAPGVLATGSPAKFAFVLSQLLAGVACDFTIYDEWGHAVAYFSSAVPSVEDQYAPSEEPVLVCEIPELPLVAGRYRINVAISQGHELVDHLEGAAVFQVCEGSLRGRPVVPNRFGKIHIAHRWLLPQTSNSASHDRHRIFLQPHNNTQ
jgi:lipopolysaccharide transport system ATP-binding protein